MATPFFDWASFPAGVKFEPSDVQLLQHLAAKVNEEAIRGGRLRTDLAGAFRNAHATHPLIGQFVPTLNCDDGICGVHPEDLPGISKEGVTRHYFHRPSRAYSFGSRKRRKIQSDVPVNASDNSQLVPTQRRRKDYRWHKTGKTRPVLGRDRKQIGWKKILVLYETVSSSASRTKKQIPAQGQASSSAGGAEGPEQKAAKSSKDRKTNWIMHQYHLGREQEEKEGEWVVAKVFYQVQQRQSSRFGKGVKLEGDAPEASFKTEEDDEGEEEEEGEEAEGGVVEEDEIEDGSDSEDKGRKRTRGAKDGAAPEASTLTTQGTPYPLFRPKAEIARPGFQPDLGGASPQPHLQPPSQSPAVPAQAPVPHRPIALRHGMRNNGSLNNTQKLQADGGGGQMPAPGQGNLNMVSVGQGTMTRLVGSHQVPLSSAPAAGLRPAGSMQVPVSAALPPGPPLSSAVARPVPARPGPPVTKLSAQSHLPSGVRAVSGNEGSFAAQASSVSAMEPPSHGRTAFSPVTSNGSNGQGCSLQSTSASHTAEGSMGLPPQHITAQGVQHQVQSAVRAASSAGRAASSAAIAAYTAAVSQGPGQFATTSVPVRNSLSPGLTPQGMLQPGMKQQPSHDLASASRLSIKVMQSGGGSSHSVPLSKVLHQEQQSGGNPAIARPLESSLVSPQAGGAARPLAHAAPSREFELRPCSAKKGAEGSLQLKPTESLGDSAAAAESPGQSILHCQGTDPQGNTPAGYQQPAADVSPPSKEEGAPPRSQWVLVGGTRYAPEEAPTQFECSQMSEDSGFAERMLLTPPDDMTLLNRSLSVTGKPPTGKGIEEARSREGSSEKAAKEAEEAGDRVLNHLKKCAKGVSICRSRRAPDSVLPSKPSIISGKSRSAFSASPQKEMPAPRQQSSEDTRSASTSSAKESGGSGQTVGAREEGAGEEDQKSPDAEKEKEAHDGGNSPWADADTGPLVLTSQDFRDAGANLEEDEGGKRKIQGPSEVMASAGTQDSELEPLRLSQLASPPVFSSQDHRELSTLFCSPPADNAPSLLSSRTLAPAADVSSTQDVIPMQGMLAAQPVAPTPPVEMEGGFIPESCEGSGEKEQAELDKAPPAASASKDESAGKSSDGTDEDARESSGLDVLAAVTADGDQNKGSKTRDPSAAANVAVAGGGFMTEADEAAIAAKSSDEQRDDAETDATTGSGEGSSPLRPSAFARKPNKRKMGLVQAGKKGRRADEGAGRGPGQKGLKESWRLHVDA